MDKIGTELSLTKINVFGCPLLQPPDFASLSVQQGLFLGSFFII